MHVHMYGFRRAVHMSVLWQNIYHQRRRVAGPPPCLEKGLIYLVCRAVSSIRAERKESAACVSCCRVFVSANINNLHTISTTDV